jgi:hypothetical protein
MGLEELLHILQTYKTMLRDVHDAIHNARDVTEDAEAYIKAGSAQERIGLAYQWNALHVLVEFFAEANVQISDLEQRIDNIIAGLHE